MELNEELLEKGTEALDKFLVLDTNILLLDANNLLNLSTNDNIIVLPETVLEEMDSKKTLMNELGYQARSFGRLLAKAEIVGMDQDEESTCTILELEDAKIWITSLNKYEAEKGSDSYNDQKIIEVANFIRKRMDRSATTFMSNDVLCRLRGLASGLQVTDYKIVETTSFDFVKEFDIEDDEVFRTLHNTRIEDVDLGYLPQNYSYKFQNPHTGQIKIGTIVNNQINIIGKDTEKELRKQDINPMNAEQLLLSKAIQDSTIDIVVCEAKAGSGKTAISLSNAIRLVKQGKYQGITYIRNSIDDVEQGEDIGYLAGNEEKLAVYLHPLHDTLDFIVRNRYKDTKIKGEEFELKVQEEVQKLIEKHNIEGMIGLGLRGRTFNDQIIIIDEAQNMSKASMQKAITRVGKNCLLIIIGSNRQIDNAYLTKFNNGMSTLLDACTKEPNANVRLFAIQLQKVLRGPIAEFAEDLFSKNYN